MNLKLTIFFFIFLDMKIQLDNRDFVFPMEYYMVDDANQFREEL